MSHDQIQIRASVKFNDGISIEERITATREQAQKAADLMEEAQEAAHKAVSLMTASRYERQMRANEAAALLGISPQYMSDIENARRGVSLEFLRKLQKWR